MTTYYPKISEFTYKDKYLNLKVPVRIKKIKMERYRCPHCSAEASKQQFIQYYLDCHKGNIGEMETKFNPITGKSQYVNVPKEMQAGYNQMICPRCLLGGSNDQVLVHTELIRYKLWAKTSIRFIDFESLLTQVIPARWVFSKRGRSALNNSTDATAFYKTLADPVELIKYSASRKRKGFKMKVFDIKEEQLDADLEKYEMRKVARRI
jgi:hypothetical protein